MKKVQKIVSLLLGMVMLISIILPCYAEMTILRMRNGVLEMQFKDKEASTNTIYKTVGWIVHPTLASNRNAAHTQKYGYMNLSQLNSRPIGSGLVLTDFEIPLDDVSKALNKAGLEDATEGTTVYLDSIFEVYHNGKTDGTKYYTYNEIANAAPWGEQTIEDLKHYYNRPIPISSGLHPLSLETRVNGKLIKPKEHIKDLKTGEQDTVKIDETMIYNGKLTKLKKTYFYKDLESIKPIAGSEKFMPDPQTMNRQPKMVAGGLTVVRDYEYSPTLTVEHMDKDTGQLLEPSVTREVKTGEVVSESKKDTFKKEYVYSEISIDGGKTWTQRSDKATRSLPINVDTIIRFYYANTELMAILNLTATPNVIEKDKKETVSFTLDAAASKAKSGIKQYEFWFGDSDNFDRKPDYVVNASNKVVVKNNVVSNSTWYGKVQITDTQGNKADSTAQVTIGELEPKPTAEVKAKLKLDVVRNSPRILRFDNSYGEDCFIDIFVPNSWKDANGRYEDVELDFTLDASESKSTNGVGNYKFDIGNTAQTIQDGVSSIAPSFSVKFVSGPQDVIDGSYANDYSHNMYFRVEATDSKVTTAKDQAYVNLYYKYFFEKDVPKVKLAINNTDFGIGEEATFTPTFFENNDTYTIARKSWEIGSVAGNFNVDGEGEIPNKYILNFAEGKYFAKQYIYYKDDKGNDKEAFAKVEFNVWNMKAPGVTIGSDKEKYFLPTTGYFKVTYDNNPRFTYPISSKSWKLRTEQGKEIKVGNGEFPKSCYFEDTLDAGYYIAEQTIHWWEQGTEKTKTATCKFKLISPKPVADFRVDMKMDNNPTPTWNRIDVPGQSGKQFKQIKIDLTPSIKLNQELENPYPLNFASSKTLIQILPLTADAMAADRTKNNTIHTPVATDIQLVENTVTIKGKQFTNVRFDKPGRYRIKAQVDNGHYISNLATRDITIRKDLPPIVDMNLDGVIQDNGENKVYRTTSDLKVRFGVNAIARTQDEDILDYNSAKLQIRYDYDADGDSSNDGIHSQMYVAKANNSVQPYVENITKNDHMSRFDITMFSKDFPVLGKMRLEYEIGEIPTIPDFLGGTMPPVPRSKGTTDAVPINKKVLLADNQKGNIKIKMGKEQRMEFIIIMDSDTLHFDLPTFQAHYKDSKITVIDKDGKHHLIQ